MDYSYHVKDENATTELALRIAKLLKPNDVILLKGKLGSGKTFFAKGIGLGLKVNETVISPTFNIVRCYFKGILPLYHIDAYRLEGLKQDIGLDEYFEANGVTLIEWPEFIDYILPSSYLEINIDIVDECERDYRFKAVGKRYEELLEAIRDE